MKSISKQNIKPITMKYFRVIPLFFLAVFYSCEKIIDIEIPDDEKKLVINSVIASDSSIVINISKSLNILDNEDVSFINDATVKLYEDGVLIAEPDCSGGGNYLATGISPLEGKKYKIEASYGALKPASAEASIPTAVEIISIDTASFDFQGTPTVQCAIEFNDPSDEENYYILTAVITTISPWDSLYPYTYSLFFYTMDVNVEDYLDVNNGILIRDNIFDGKNYKMIVNIDEYNFSKFYSKVDFQLQSVSKDYYLYALSYTRHRRTMNNPFAEPCQVYSNIKDGFGIFGAYSVSQKSVTFIGYGDEIIYE